MVRVSIDQTALPHSRALCFAGAACDFRTNSPELARVLEVLSITTGETALSGFHMRVVVDESTDEGAENLIFGAHHVNGVVVDRTCFALTSFSTQCTRFGLCADYRWEKYRSRSALWVRDGVGSVVPVWSYGTLIAERRARKSLCPWLFGGRFQYVSMTGPLSQCRLYRGSWNVGASKVFALDAVRHFQNLGAQITDVDEWRELAYD
jgi:hypothetical protein